MSRRRLLASLGTGSSVLLAGCGGGGEAEDGGTDATEGPTDTEGNGQDGSELGERVPNLVIEYWADVGRLSQREQSLNLAANDISEVLGVGTDIKPVDIGTQIGSSIQDLRTNHLHQASYITQPIRLEPTSVLSDYLIQNAGAGGRNPLHYTSCEYTNAVMKQSSIADTERRQELVSEALRTMGEDRAMIPYASSLDIGAVRTDSMTPKRTGKAGVNRMNPMFYIYSEPVDSDVFTVKISPLETESRTFIRISTSISLNLWLNLIHSPLLEYNENYELENSLAEEVTTENDGQIVTVTLKEAEFHNGDPVTAEDVKFTFNYPQQYPEAVPTAQNIPFESINVIDDRTVEFNFKEPFPPFLTRDLAFWGIWHKQTFLDSGAEEDPTGFSLDKVVGSGPFELSTLQTGEFLEMTPFDGHPKHQPSHRLILQAFRGGASSALESFRQNDIQVITEISPSMANDLEDALGDVVEIVSEDPIFPLGLNPQHNVAPTKFPVFRDAIGKAINRERINQVAFNGLSDMPLAPLVFLKNHPWRLEDYEDSFYKFTDDTSGDAEAARGVLENAGWGWDDNGNLRYPPDADLSPKWPAESTPDPSEFPCLDEEGNYQPP